MSSSTAMQSLEPKHPGGDHHDHGAHVGTLVIIYITLMCLLALTVIAAFAGEKMHFDRLNIVIAIAIALVKAAMVVWIFMHVKYGSNVIKLYAFAAIVFLGIMLTLTFGDYLSRGELPRSDTFVSEPHHRNPQTDYQHPASLDSSGNAIVAEPVAEEAKHE